MIRIYGVILLSFAILSCSSGNPGSSNVQINVPESTKQFLARIKIDKNYIFYSMKGAPPKTIDDLRERVLIFFSDEKFIGPTGGNLSRLPKIDAELIFSSVKDTGYILFKSSKCYSIFQGLISRKPPGEPASRLQSDFSYGKEGAKKSFVQEIFGFTEETPLSAIQDKCLKEMQNNNKSILMIKRELKIRKPGEMVEVVLK
jgi:hypothetical protein